MGVSSFPSFSINYWQRREQLSPQIIAQAENLIGLYYETHGLIKQQYAQLPKKAIVLAKAQKKPLSKENIKACYRACVFAFGKYTLPLFSGKRVYSLQENFKNPLIPGLLHFYVHRMEVADFSVYKILYPYPLKKPEIHWLPPAIPKTESQQCMRNFFSQNHSVDTQSYTIPLAKFNNQQLKPRFKGILRAQYALENLRTQYANTYPDNTDEAINTLINKAHASYHRQRSKNNALYFLATPIHWSAGKAAEITSYMIEQHWIACFVAVLAVVAGAVMLSFGYPPVLTLLWNTCNTSIILNPIATAIASLTLYALAAFLATVATFELLYLTQRNNKKNQQGWIKEAQEEIIGINLPKDPSYKKMIEQSKSYFSQGTYKSHFPSGFSKPLKTWGEKFTHYFSHKYEIVVGDEGNHSSALNSQPWKLQRGK